MRSEIQSAGLKEFFIALLWAALLFTLGSMTSYAVSLYKIISGAGTLLLLCVYAFFVLTRYSAVFTYTLEDKRLRVNRKIGHRNKELEIRYRDVLEITDADPRIRRTARMKKYVMRNRRDVYVVYNDKGEKRCLLFCPSAEFLKRFKKAIKKG